MSLAIQLRAHSDFENQLLAIFPDVPLWCVIEAGREADLREALDQSERGLRVDDEWQPLMDVLHGRASGDLPFGEVLTSSGAVRRSRLVLDVTSACNLRCPHCSASAEFGPVRAAMLSRSEVAAILDAIVSEEQTDVGPVQNCVHVVGGEPMMHPELPDIFDEIASRGFTPTVISNLTSRGLVLQFLDAMAQRDYAYELSVSLDGWDTDSNAPTRGAAAYAATIANLELLRERGISFSLNPLVHAGNFSSLERILDHHVAQGCSEINVLSLKEVGRALGGELRPVSQFDIYRELLRIYARRPDLRPYLRDTRFWFYLRSLMTARPKTSCGVCTSSAAYVASDGQAYLCGYLTQPEYAVGSVTQEGYGAVWTTERRTALSDQFLLANTECADCYLRHFCGGGCRAEIVGAGKAPGAVHPGCEPMRNSIEGLMFELAAHPGIV